MPCKSQSCYQRDRHAREWYKSTSVNLVGWDWLYHKKLSGILQNSSVWIHNRKTYSRLYLADSFCNIDFRFRISVFNDINGIITGKAFCITIATAQGKETSLKATSWLSKFWESYPTLFCAQGIFRKAGRRQCYFHSWPFCWRCEQWHYSHYNSLYVTDVCPQINGLITSMYGPKAIRESAWMLVTLFQTRTITS